MGNGEKNNRPASRVNAMQGMAAQALLPIAINEIPAAKKIRVGFKHTWTNTGAMLTAICSIDMTIAGVVVAGLKNSPVKLPRIWSR